MELLVVTLVHTTVSRDTDALAYIRLIADTVRTAPGLITSHFYRGRNTDAYYLILTTWESHESWRKAQEHYNPKYLLMATAELLTAPPEQWLMHYLWGYTRPSASPATTTAHLIIAHPEQIEHAQQIWMRVLQEQAQQSTLAFAFLAQGIDDDATAPRRAIKTGTTVLSLDTNLLSFLSWASDVEREAFYQNPDYRSINTVESNAGIAQMLPLEPL